MGWAPAAGGEEPKPYWTRNVAGFGQGFVEMSEEWKHTSKVGESMMGGDIPTEAKERICRTVCITKGQGSAEMYADGRSMG